MLNIFDFKQKPLKKRFLLILGLVTFICFIGLGFMIMFWNQLPLNMTKTQRYGFGSVIIIYAIIRFSRLFKRDETEKF
jgi:peptidoglycan/LPS O-acetylase OafA/YrhL